MSEPARTKPVPAAPLRADEDSLVRAAWAYYVEGLTQGEVAARLGLNRVRVNRMLAQARDSGLVQIRINTSLAIDLERRIESRFGLQRASIVPSPADPQNLANVIAVAAAAELSGRIRDDMSVGVGWGRTLQLSLQSLERRTYSGLSVVSLLGGLTHGSVMNTYETASRLAGIFGASCSYIAGPALADTPETRDVLLAQSIVRDALEQARKADLALLSVGSLTPDATMLRLGILSPEDRASLAEAGAVGDICAHWIDASGKTIDHPLNRRVIALPPPELAGIGTVILASGGADKIPVIRAALRLGVIDVLVTDEATAEGLIAEDGEG
ncbi:MAG: sugar-binding transcriptional regulator [Rhodobiaceae bacterium]|nr:sugar-binding transcriptional regulator [Rhodobiaceae bacterium]